MKPKRELVIGFHGKQQDDGSYIYREGKYTNFTKQEYEAVLRSGVRLNHTYTWPNGNYSREERIVRNQIWSDPNGFEIIDYGKSTATAFFTVMIESDMKADIKIDTLFSLVKAGKIRDGKVYADLSFRAFGGSKYLVESI